MAAHRERPWRGWVRVMGGGWKYVLDFQPGEDEVKAIVSLYEIARDKMRTYNVTVSAVRLPPDETPRYGGILNGERGW